MPSPEVIGLTTENEVEVINAFTATNQQLPVVAAEPGWYVVGSFWLTASALARLDVVGCVSNDGNTLRVRLFDLDPDVNAPVAGSQVEIEDAIDTHVVSTPLQLTGRRIYQVQAEAIGPDGFAVVKSAQLV